MKRYQKKRNTHKICRWCLQDMEFCNGKQACYQIWTSPEDEKGSFCEFCKKSGFDSLYVLV